MRIEWSSGLSRSLRSAGDDSLYELYHENSKLFPETAQHQAASFTVSPFELHVASRGFRQHLDAPQVPLPEPAVGTAVAEVMQRRRSNRELSHPISVPALAAVLGRALGVTAVVENEQAGVVQALRAWPSAGGLYPLDTYVVASDVAGAPPGVYHFNVLTSALERLSGCRHPRDVLRDGFFWQDFAVTASAAVLLVAAFDRTIAKYGERGYRLVLLDAGHAAQNVLLAAEDLRLPAVAVAGFCDDSLAADLAVDGLSEAVVHAVLLGGPSHDD